MAERKFDRDFVVRVAGRAGGGGPPTPPLPPERYVYNEVNALANSPFDCPEEYHNVVGVYSGLGPTVVNLPQNPAEEPRIVTVMDIDGAAAGNPITVNWNSNTVTVLAKPLIRATFIYDIFQNAWQLTSYFEGANINDYSYFMLNAPVALAGVFPFANLVSPLGPAFKFMITHAAIIKGSGTWTAAPSVSLGTNIPNVNNIMPNGSLTIAPNQGRQMTGASMFLHNSDIFYRVHTPGATTTGTPAVDIFVRGWWVPQTVI